MPDVVTTKQQSAQRQIEATIRDLRHVELDCAITLAAAAEGMLPPTEDPHLFGKLRRRPEFRELDLNLVINWLKHSDGPENATISEFEAVFVIARAITKFIAAYHGSTKGFRDF